MAYTQAGDGLAANDGDRSGTTAMDVSLVSRSSPLTACNEPASYHLMAILIPAPLSLAPQLPHLALQLRGGRHHRAVHRQLGALRRRRCPLVCILQLSTQLLHPSLQHGPRLEQLALRLLQAGDGVPQAGHLTRVPLVCLRQGLWWAGVQMYGLGWVVIRAGVETYDT